MTRAEKIIKEIYDELIHIDQKLRDLGHYFIFYTHTYEQKNEIGKNVLSVPKSSRFDESEFYGLLIDMVRDYADARGVKLKGDRDLAAFINVLKDIEGD